MQQVREAPDVSADLPIARQMEQHLSDHHGADTYWTVGSKALPLIALSYRMESRQA